MNISFCKWILLLGNGFLSFSMVAATLDAKSIYEKATHHLKNTSFQTSSATVSNGVKTTRIRYQYVSPDGIVYERQENLTESKNPDAPASSLIMIANEEGRFLLNNGSVTKINYQYGRKPLNEEGLDISYRLENAHTKGVDCYKITRRITLNHAAEKAFNHSLPEELRNNKDFSTFPAMEIILIGKDDLFPRESAQYDSTGKLIGKKDYSNLELNPDIDLNLFHIPTSKTKIATTISEYSKITSQNIQKNRKTNPPKLKKSWWSIIDDHFSSIATWGTRGGIAIAILAIFFAVAIKMKQR